MRWDSDKSDERSPNREENFSILLNIGRWVMFKKIDGKN